MVEFGFTTLVAVAAPAPYRRTAIPCSSCKRPSSSRPRSFHVSAKIRAASHSSRHHERKERLIEVTGNCRHEGPCLLDRKQVDSPAVLSGTVDRISRVREHEVSYRRFEHGSQRRGSLTIESW